MGNTRTQLMSMSGLSNLSRAMFMLCMCIHICSMICAGTGTESILLLAWGRSRMVEGTGVRLQCHAHIFPVILAFISSLRFILLLSHPC